MYEVVETREHIYIVTEHVEGGELFDHITRVGRLPEHEARHLFQQMIAGRVVVVFLGGGCGLGMGNDRVWHKRGEYCCSFRVVLVYNAVYGNARRNLHTLMLLCVELFMFTITITIIITT